MSLREKLKHVLPKDKEYIIHHFQSKPRDTHPLVYTSRTDLKTIKVEDFITLSHQELVFYGLEIFIYITIDTVNDTTERLLFVSKADTNGLNESKVNIGKVTETIIKYLLHIPIDHYFKEIIPKEATYIKYERNKINRYTSTKEALRILLERHQGKTAKPEQIKPYSITIYPTNVITKISLFTRAEPQYLFPESGKNPSKHILGGEGLLKWWLKLLDSILTDFDTSIAKLQIPAEEPKVIRRYFTNLKSNWQIGDVYGGESSDIAVFKVPLFPDDPKSRFIEHLVVEGRAKKITLNQFWQELQVRQEFRLGVTVSVIGIEGRLKPLRTNLEDLDLLVLSHKHFKKLKTYITGEDYSTSEGAIEAHRNVSDYIVNQLGQSLEPVVGEFVKPIPVINSIPVKRLEVNNLSGMIRKKSKK